MSNVGEKFQLSRDEFRNITRCLENEEFRKLFVEYCEELNDPENCAKYESELKLLEAERGYDVKFIKPLPGYVIKSITGEKMKAFVNVCHSDLLGKPTSQCSVNENGQKGLTWSIPYAQCQPRKDYDNKRIECVVYDVVFHYDTLYLANRNQNFRKLVTDTALDAIEKSFGVILDKNNLRFPKLQYKGVPKMTVIRQKLSNQQGLSNNCIVDQLKRNFESETIAEDENDKENNESRSVAHKGEYLTPSYKLVHRREIEYHEMTEEVDARIDATVPKELILKIELPLLRSVQDCVLNVTSKHLHLSSENPAKYKLEVKLPYEVAEKDGSAKFDIDEKILVVNLPVIPPRRITLNDINSRNHLENQTTKSGDMNIESTRLSNETSNEPVEPPKEIRKTSNNAPKKFILPKFSANKMDNIFAFTLNVRNVDPESIQLIKGIDTVSCKFSNIGNGFFPCYYVFFVRFPNANVTEVQHEEWDNNLILQVILDDSRTNRYYVGADESELTQYSIMEDIGDKINKFGKEIEDDSLCIAVSKNTVKQERRSAFSIEIKMKSDSDTDSDHKDNMQEDHKTEQSMNQNAKEKNNTAEKSTNNGESKLSDVKCDREAHDDGSEGRKCKRNSRRKNKKRSLSESCCDQLKEIVVNDVSPCTPNTTDSQQILRNNSSDCETVSNVKQRKPRSVSESSVKCASGENINIDSASVDNLTALIQFNRKYKGILKRSSFERSISECSSVDDPIYLATSGDASSVAGSIDHSHGELSESCRKTVRFNDLIKTKIFRSNTSILGQKKKNSKKNESKKRALTRRLSEGESTDNDDKDHGTSEESVPELQTENEHDSGISLDSDAGLSVDKGDDLSDCATQLNSKPIQITTNVGKNVVNNKKEESNKKSKPSLCKTSPKVYSSDLEYKSEMIFDIEM